MISLPSKSPVLIVEGPGDVDAIPLLIRRVLYEWEIFDVQTSPHPKTNVEIKKLRRTGELERYVEYAAREGDGVLIALDCEDFCPVDIAKEFYHRLLQLKIEKRVAIMLFRSEFESMFFWSIEEIVEKYPEFNWVEDKVRNFKASEDIRDAKGMISGLMASGKAYKPTRHQAKFSSVIDLQKTRDHSRSFRHLESVLKWLISDNIQGDNIYPSFVHVV